jgi:hypothetical protein
MIVDADHRRRSRIESARKATRRLWHHPRAHGAYSTTTEFIREDALPIMSSPRKTDLSVLGLLRHDELDLIGRDRGHHPAVIDPYLDTPPPGVVLIRP